MKYSNIPSAHSIVYHCKSSGIKNIIISPGSRNAPLIIGFSEDSFFKCFSIVDERSAAFFALGIAQHSKEAVAVVCTSGSALLNYYPAIAESFYSNIPLVVISADRPLYKIDIGDGQTIRQNGVFEKHIGYSASLKQDVSHTTETIKQFFPEIGLESDTIKSKQAVIQKYNDSELQKALSIAVLEETPVHINVPFEEPLYGMLTERPPVVPMVVPFRITDKNNILGNVLGIDKFATIWNESKKKLILVGVNRPDTIEQQFLDEFTEDSSVLVFTETTSNMHHPNFFPSIDNILVPIEKGENSLALFKALQPDILLTFGGLIVSKKIKSFLRTFKPKHHWHIGKRKANDTFFSLSHHFNMEPNVFFHHFLNLALPIKSDYFGYWAAARKKYKDKRVSYIKDVPFSDISVFDCITKRIPKNYLVHLANSSTVRYMQLFCLDPSLHVFCNRGTSGIDGSTSTAIGASVYNESPTLFITGDLSFFYDSNALWNNYIKSNFRIILINNSGGGIFRILSDMGAIYNFEDYFETPHNLNASAICKMHGFEYAVVSDLSDLENSLEYFYDKSESPKLLEIKTPRLLNDKILLNYFDFIS